MRNEEKIKQFRQEIALKLKEWIPKNDALVVKELGIFDKVMNRREFLTTTSTAAFALLYQGCSNKPPSQWPDAPIGMLSEDELTSVKKTSKITVDSDLLDSVVPYAPIQAEGSSDALYIKKSAVLEAFNPHVMSVESMDVFEESGLNKPNKNYGGVDIVHLEKESENTNYALKIYEKNEQNTLDTKMIELPDSKNIEYSTLVAANGNFHNKVRDGQIYSQKLIAFATPIDAKKSDLRVYYKNYEGNLLLPGVAYEGEKDVLWEYLDILEIFEYVEEYSFQTYKILDLNSYSDGEGNSFIYGTLCFDDLYCYGFVISYTSAYASKPRVSFFTPQFLSVKSQTISSLNALNQEFKNFSVIKHQKFLPFCVTKGRNGENENNLFFSFVSFDIHSIAITKNNGIYDFKELKEEYNSTIKRYLLSVDISEGGVQYLLEDYEVKKAALDEKDDVISFSFDTSDLNLTDIYREVYKTQDIGYNVAALEMQSAYVRGVSNDGEDLHVILVGTYFHKTMGLAHKSIKLDLDTYKVKELHKTKAAFDESRYGFHTYKSMWFDNLTDKYTSLHECVEKNNKEYEFYVTQNQQGLLQSYFIIKIEEVHYLISFAERGENFEGSSEKPYNFMEFSSLYNQIKNSSTPFLPPLVVASNVSSFYHTNSGAIEEELIYTAKRSRGEDATLLSYYHTFSDPLNGTWSTKEIQRTLHTTEVVTHMVKAPRHIVHMHMNNLYGHKTNLEKQHYIELRFTKPVSVYDLTDIDVPKGYDVRRSVSLFVKPDSDGKITLEVDSGVTHQEMFNGVSMLYRIVDKNDLLIQSQNALVTLNTSSHQTTSFKSINISFNMFQRLSTDKVDTFQAGVLHSDTQDPKTAYRLLHDNAKKDEKSNIKKVTDFYGTLHEIAAPKNGEMFLSLSKSSNYLDETAIVDPTTFILGAQRYTRNLRGKISHWIHHAISTIKHAIHNAAKELAQKLKKSIENLVSKVEDLSIDGTEALESIVEMLSTIVDKIVDIGKKFVLYWKEFWDFIKGFFDFRTAFDIGAEFKSIFKAQMLPDANNPKNAYGVIQEKTTQIQDKIDDAAKHFKENIDTTIDDIFIPNAKKTDDTTKKAAQEDAKDKNSVKYHHALHTMAKVHHHVTNSSQAREPIDQNKFSCNGSDNVEKLLSCMINKEYDVIKTDLMDEYSQSNKIFSNIAKNHSIGDENIAFGNFLKYTMNTVVDEFTIVADGAVQIPLAFLNGSSSVAVTEEALDNVMKVVCEILGEIFFNDSKKFKSLDDIGYFIFGYILFLELSLIAMAQNSSRMQLRTQKIDLIKYIKDGTFKQELNSVVTTPSNTDLLSKIVTICEAFDTILSGVDTAMGFFRGRVSISTFNILGILIKTINIIRIFLRLPKLLKHIEIKANTAGKTASKIFIIIADFFHLSILVTNIFRSGTFSYDYFKSGVPARSIFTGLSIVHAILTILKSAMEAGSVSSLGDGNDDKRKLELDKKILGLIASVAGATLDFLSLTDPQESEMPDIIVAKNVCYTIMVVCYGGMAAITVSFMYNAMINTNEA